IGDIERGFSVNKTKAQRSLKYFHAANVLFTANDLILEGITALPNKNPQQYFPTCIKAEIIEGLSKRKNVLVDPTGVDLLVPASSNLVSATSNDLEGYLLPLLPQAPIFLHNLHFKIGIDPECYVDLNLPYYDKNNGKRHSENIGTSHVEYVLYPNGTVDIQVRCSNNPFKLETEVDRSRIIAFFEKKLKQRGNVPIQLTEVTSSKALLSQVTSSDANSKTSSKAPLSLEEQKAQNLLDALHLLDHSPLYIHKLQLQVPLDSRYYADIQKDCSEYNKAKQHEERIGTAVVKYLVYPNGKTMVFVACSNNPFKLEDEADESILYSFLGQVLLFFFFW
ncbi:MAG: hypothetical protein WAM14_19700, partial [Candidatus Nitrosopolaris sp.]